MKSSFRLFCQLPLGTRFSYNAQSQVWVVLATHGCGLIAKWEGVDVPVAGQPICSFENSEAACKAGMVYVREDAPRVAAPVVQVE